MAAVSSKTHAFVSRFGKMVPFLFVTLLSGCVESGDQGELVGSTQMSFEEFEAQTFREPDTGIYVVDGDTPIDDIKKLAEFYETHVQQLALIVHREGGSDAKWSDAQRMNLTYCVSTSFGTRYQTAISAMADAAAAWEAVIPVKYIHVSAQDSNCTASNQNVLFDVRPTSSGSYLARAFFPNDSRSSRNVLIDSTAFQSNGNLTVVGVLRHELGHTLGFRHEHTRPEAGTCFEDNQWRALTSYDSASVMHYPQCSGTGDKTLSLTSKDIQGAQVLYGTVDGGGGEPQDPQDPSGTPTTATWDGSVAKGQSMQLEPVEAQAGTTIQVTMTGTGDPDLYVRFGAEPTLSKWNCRPYKTGPNEQCDLTVPEGKPTVYFMVRGYAAGQFVVTAEYTAP